MDKITGFALFSACLLQLSSALTIREIINQRVELQQLNQYMSGTDFMAELGTTGTVQKYTCFLPHNDAFKNVPHVSLQRYLSQSTTAKDEFSSLVKYHCQFSFDGSEVIYTNRISDQVVKSHAIGAPNFFLKQIGDSYFMNGARIIESDIPASNGIVHIIDHFHTEVGLTTNALYTIQTNTQSGSELSTSKFWSLIQEYIDTVSQQQSSAPRADYHMNADSRITVFIPTDEAFNNLPSNAFERLMRDQNLRKVIEAHVIAGSVQHANILSLSLNQEISAMSGSIVPKLFGAHMYVSNDCAQAKIVRSNYTVENGVIHMIDNVLGIVFTDAFQEIERQDTLRKFYNHLRSGDPSIESSLQMPPGFTGDVPTNQQLTIFAPIDTAFINVDLTQDSKALNTVLRKHMIQGRVELADMIDGTSRETQTRDVYAKFTQEGDDTFVEIDHVKGKIIDGNICVKNGIIHKVDMILGFTSSSIMDVIDGNLELAEFYKVIKSNGMNGYLNDPTKRLTLFAPTNQAFELMRTGSMGRKLLDPENSKNMKRVINRHIMTTEFYTDELSMGQERILSTLFDDITIEKVTKKEITLKFGAGVGLVRYDVRCANGVIHFIDSVLYSEGNPNSSEWVGAASTCYISLVLLLSLQIVVLLM